MIKNNYFILTGGPGSGKTTVINILKEKGYIGVEECGRNIIVEQVKNKGDAVPWKNVKKYAQLMFEQSVRDYTNYLPSKEMIFFDRGIPDIYGYEKMMGIECELLLEDTLKKFRYNKLVFIFPPWIEIYTTDKERKQDFNEASDTFRMMEKVYGDLGYDLKEVPRISPADRADFVLDQIKMNEF